MIVTADVSVGPTTDEALPLKGAPGSVSVTPVVIGVSRAQCVVIGPLETDVVGGDEGWGNDRV